LFDVIPIPTTGLIIAGVVSHGPCSCNATFLYPFTLTHSVRIVSLVYC